MNDNTDYPREDAANRDVEDGIPRALLDHIQHPRNPGRMAHADGHGTVTGSCGDTIEMFVCVRGDRIVKSSFDCRGCAYTLACASVASEIIVGKTFGQARRDVSPDAIAATLGGLPEDHLHCASLATHSVHEALDDAMKTAREPWRKSFRH